MCSLWRAVIYKFSSPFQESIHSNSEAIVSQMIDLLESVPLASHKLWLFEFVHFQRFFFVGASACLNIFWLSYYFSAFQRLLCHFQSSSLS